MTAVRLDRSSWPAARDRSARIVHVGLGNFSRAHQAWYTARADETGEWGIAAFTGRHGDLAGRLARQGGLYTLIERGPVTDRLTVIDALCFARPGADLAGLVQAIAAPQTALVTLTVTEAGYRPVATSRSGDAEPLPSVPTRLARGLDARRRAAAGPLAVISCDNLHNNGSVLRARTLEAAEAIDPALIGWIESQVAFVTTSVDRITPRASDSDRAVVQRELHRIDEAVVVSEPFSDWVLCGEFPAGRPKWEDAGARFVSQIEPWELRKLWLLNGGHSLLAYVGLLRGHQTVAAAVADRDISLALDEFWDLVVRHLPATDLDLDLPAYRRQLRERFVNARIGYPLEQIAGDGLDKLRNRIVPVIEAALAAGESAEPAVRVIRAWAQWLIGDASRLRTDQNAELLRSALDSRGADAQARGLLELLAPGLFTMTTTISEVGQ
jgi:fructuronate reductase